MIFSKGPQKKTLVNLPDFKLNLELSPIGFLGSCFAIEIQKRFADAKFNSWTNPGGTLYNPRSICDRLERLLSYEAFHFSELFKTPTDDYRHWLFDTQLSNSDPDKLINELNEMASQFKINWEQSSTLVITLGSSWVYQLKDSGHIVANCHKLPAIHFIKKILSAHEIDSSIQKIKSLAKNKTLIWTLSPIRHWSDGAEANSLSKALLRISIDQNLDAKNLYFPSYEIVMDEFRDYQYYNHDGIHLNADLIDIVADRFLKSLNSSKISEYVKKGIQLKNLEHHRPIDKQKKDLHLSKIQALKIELGLN